MTVPSRTSPALNRLARRLLATGLLAWALTAALTAAVCVGWMHDEEQYVAAAVLARDHALYRSLMYLQTPLQPLVLAALLGGLHGHFYLATRLFSAALALGGAGAAGAVVRLAGRRGMPGLMTAALFFTSLTLMRTAGTARNDILPCALMLVGLAAVAGAESGTIRRAWLGWGAAGLAFALAAATKATYAFGPLLMLAYGALALRRKAATRRDVAALVVGLGLGSLPVLLALAAEPHNALFDMVLYHRGLPAAWYRMNGQADMLGPGHWAVFLQDWLVSDPGAGLVGVGLLVVGLAGGGSWRLARNLAAGRWGLGELVAAMTALSLLLALLPDPPQPTYMVPVAALLVVGFGLALGPLETLARPLRLTLACGVGVGAVLPILIVGAWLPLAFNPTRWPVSLAHRTAVEIRAALAAQGVRGPVATLSPIRVLDAGGTIYPELAAGPFFFRTGDLVAPAEVERLRAASPATLPALLQRRPPAAVYVGLEGHFRMAADAPLEAWAVAHGYVRTAVPEGRLYVRPPATPGRGSGRR